MLRQVYNPYLPSYEYMADVEPRVFGDRLYVFGSHDRFGGTEACLNDFVCWSTPTSDLAGWRYDGVIYERFQHPHYVDESRKILQAPDVALAPDGRYYLFYTVAGSGVVSVAVCDTPSGRYEYHGDVDPGSKNEDWYRADPAVMVDDSRIWLYLGISNGAMRRRGQPVVMELAHDMLTVIGEPRNILPPDRFFFRHGFSGAPSIRKMGDLYYLTYDARFHKGLHYCTSLCPDRDFTYRGPIHSASDIGIPGVGRRGTAYPSGGCHGGIAQVDGQAYIFNHRHTNRTAFSRQGVAQRIQIEPDGAIRQTEATSCGLNGGPLDGCGEYPAFIACNLVASVFPGIRNPFHTPYITQEGPDRDSPPSQYIAGMGSGGMAGFKSFHFNGETVATVTLRGSARGRMHVRIKPAGKPLATFDIALDTGGWKEFTTKIKMPSDVHPVFYQYQGRGSVDFVSFSFQ